VIRKVAIAATAALIVGAGLLLSFYLLALSAAGYLVIYVLRRLRGHRWAKVIWTLLLLVGVLVFARMRKSTVPQDCDATAKSFIGRADNGQSPGLRPEPRDAVSTSREHFQDFSRTVLAHANVAMKTERVLIDARKLLNGLIPIGESGDAATRTVSSAIDELQASWSKQKLSNTAAK